MFQSFSVIEGDSQLSYSQASSCFVPHSGLMRTRNDILDRVSLLLKDSSYVEATYKDSAQKDKRLARLKDVRLSLRAIPLKMHGSSAIKPTDDEPNCQEVDSPYQ
jgi:hypothetical protein